MHFVQSCMQCLYLCCFVFVAYLTVFLLPSLSLCHFFLDILTLCCQVAVVLQFCHCHFVTFFLSICHFIAVILMHCHFHFSTLPLSVHCFGTDAMSLSLWHDHFVTSLLSLLYVAVVLSLYCCHFVITVTLFLLLCQHHIVTTTLPLSLSHSLCCHFLAVTCQCWVASLSQLLSHCCF